MAENNENLVMENEEIQTDAEKEQNGDFHDDKHDDLRSENAKLRRKLIISILLFLITIVMMATGIWAAQAGKDFFNGNVIVTTKDINARITALVTGTKNEGEGFENEKILWDSEFSEETNALASWKNIDLTFANKNTPIEITINVDNRKVGSEINTIFTANLGGVQLTSVEQEIEDTNLIAYIVAPTQIGSAIDETIFTTGTFKVVIKVANKNYSVKATELDASLILTDPNTKA